MHSPFLFFLRCRCWWIAALLFVGLARADVVVLRSGERIEGKITLETSSRLIIAQPNGKRTVERASIDKIERGPIESVRETTAAPITAPAPEKATAPSVEFWPPVKDRPFPDLTLFDREGRLVRLSSFRGKIIILEPVGMTCSACNAFSGGNKVGGFEGVQPQADCPALDEFFTVKSTGTTLGDPRIVWVQLLLYNMQMQAPTVDDLKRWSAHFPALRKPNCVVLAATPEMLGKASYAMIPGVQLIDRQFILRSDFRGHGGGDDLNGHLLRLVREMINGPVH